MATDQPKQDTSPTSADPPKESANEPSGPIGRLRHDHLDLDAEERRHRRDKRGGLPVMPIILGLTLLTAVIFYVLHLHAVAKDEAAAKQRAAQAAAAASQVPPPPPSPPPSAAAPTVSPAETAKPAAPPITAKPADAKSADTKPTAEHKTEAKPARPAKKADDKTKNLPRLPVLPEG